MSATFEKLCAHLRETAKLESIKELLEWDERTIMPPAAGEYRAEQIAYLSGLTHQRRIAPQVGEWLEELATGPLVCDPHSDAGTTIRQTRRDFQRRTKLPTRLVEEITRASILGQQAWVAARHNDDFAAFLPYLAKIVDLKRQEAAALDIGDCLYDSLLDEYEPDERTADVARVLAGLRNALVPLLAAIAASGRASPRDILTRQYPVDGQERFGTQAAAAIGFDFTRGRLDVTPHPFCSGMGPSDCRITTRYAERYFPSAFFGILHEAGHGLYEQGLRTNQFGLPPGRYTSLGIHESQSRMWENFVGRRRSFWQHFFPLAQQAFPQALAGVGLDEFHFAINDVRPSLIRVEADEATYNLHIIIRFELEQALIHGHLAPADVPTAWRGKYRDYLSVEPSNNADGSLQDIHWSAGLIGYFPTYSLGNLYAAQFFAQADIELGGLDSLFARGEFAPLREWLQEKIYTHGQCYSARELVQRITGQPLGHEPLMRHLREKLGPLYGL